MKKKTVTLLSLVLSLSLSGCGGNSAETNQESQTQEQEDIVYEDDEEEYEEENKYEDIIGKEFENDDIYIKVENTEQMFGVDDEWEEAYGQITTNKDIPIYCDGGFEIGYIKTGSTIDITEHGIYNGNSSAYYRFPNPISEAPFDYLYVSYLDFDTNTFTVETESSIKHAEEWEQQKEEEANAPYVEIFEKAGYDKDKEYAIDEYIEILTKIFEEMGKECNVELAGMSPFENYDGFGIQLTHGITEYTEETTKSLINYVENGKDGFGGITEFCVVKAQNDKGEEAINLFVKIDSEEHKKNEDEFYDTYY